MKPGDREEEEVRSALQKAFPATETKLRRDLWPAMLRRMQEQPVVAVPWYDWALAACLAGAFVFFPKLALLLAYHL